MVASGRYRSATALAVLPDPRPPRRTVVERPQFLPRLLRASVLGFRDLAGAVPAHHTHPEALLVGPAVPGVRTMRACNRPDGRRTLPFPLVAVDRPRQLDR